MNLLCIDELLVLLLEISVNVKAAGAELGVCHVASGEHEQELNPNHSTSLA